MKKVTSASKRPSPVPRGSRAAMVGWFDPSQLLDTAVKVIVSSLFGRQADRRLLDAVAHHNPDPCDRSNCDEFWIDYVADTGDGFNSTYAVAYYASMPLLSVRDPTGRMHATKRGELLVFGGDEVYPTGGRDAYEAKLVAPYRTALAQTIEPNPTVLAIPGNHDWYDGLVAFTRLFCSDKGRWIGGRQTEQNLSYFAVKLPHHWWLIGTDMQLESDIDDPQLEYFRGIAHGMDQEDRVILCLAEPEWIKEARYRKFDSSINQKNLKVLEEDVFKRRVAVFLAGDLHHYRRHADDEGRQKITAGGGGAFLHATHADAKEVATIGDSYTKRAEFPSIAKSRALSYLNFAFPILNPTFGFATAALYALLGWAVQADLSHVSDLRMASSITLTALLRSQIASFWVLLLFSGFYYFTDTASPRYKLFGGTLHALSHLAAAFFAGWASVRASALWSEFGTWQQLASTGLLVAAFGYILGAVIMGLYLFVSVNVFGRQAGEAFSSLQIQDYKSWLRIHVRRDGQLELFPIGIDRVPRKWKSGAADPGLDAEWSGLLVPDDDDKRATAPRLVEVPVPVGVLRGKRELTCSSDAHDSMSSRQA